MELAVICWNFQLRSDYETVTLEMTYVGDCDSDTCIAEYINLLYLLFIFESYFRLGQRSSPRLLLPLVSFQHH